MYGYVIKPTKKKSIIQITVVCNTMQGKTCVGCSWKTVKKKKGQSSHSKRDKKGSLLSWQNL